MIIGTMALRVVFRGSNIVNTIEGFIKDVTGIMNSELVPVEVESEIDFIAVRKSMLPTGQYALAIAPYLGELSATDNIAHYRKLIRKELKAFWGFREVGCYLILYGHDLLPEKIGEEIKADVTGLHAVIIQGIHLVDFQRCETFHAGSSWGGISFGSTNDVSGLIDQIDLQKYKGDAETESCNKVD